MLSTEEKDVNISQLYAANKARLYSSHTVYAKIERSSY